MFTHTNLTYIAGFPIRIPSYNKHINSCNYTIHGLRGKHADSNPPPRFPPHLSVSHCNFRKQLNTRVNTSIKRHVFRHFSNKREKRSTLLRGSINKDCTNGRRNLINIQTVKYSFITCLELKVGESCFCQSSRRF